MIGTDFFLMMNLFPGRTRAELKVGGNVKFYPRGSFHLIPAFCVLLHSFWGISWSVISLKESYTCILVKSVVPCKGSVNCS